MTATTEHRPAEAHNHTHGPDCGHLAVIHGDHVDYIHDGHAHREDEYIELAPVGRGMQQLVLLVAALAGVA